MGKHRGADEELQDGLETVKNSPRYLLWLLLIALAFVLLFVELPERNAGVVGAIVEGAIALANEGVLP